MHFIVISPCPLLDQPRHFIFNKYLSVLDSLSTCDIKFCVIQATKVYLSYHFALLVECVVNIMLLLFNVM